MRGRSVYRFSLAGLVTLADLIVFIHCLPIMFKAWRMKRPFMISATDLVFVWVESLANLWRLACRSLQSSANTIPSDLSVGKPVTARQGGFSNV